MTVARALPLGLGDALSQVPLSHRTHHVDGAFVPARQDATTPVHNPATGEVLLEVPSGGPGDVDAAVAAARRAAPGWRRLTPKDRAALLLELAAAIDAEAGQLVRLEALNVGKPLSVAEGEVPLASDALRFFAGTSRATFAPATGEYVEGQLSMIRREPVGVVGAITPWNYPFMLAVWKAAPALAAGNTIVIKPSELTPLTTLRLAEIASRVLPAGVLNVVLGDGRTGAALAAHPGVDLVAATGSVATGIAVARAGADTLKRVHLELGGKAPLVVFPDADLGAAVDAIRLAGYWNTGQECGAATRVLAHAHVADELLERLVPAVEGLGVGDPDEGEHVEIGPLISARRLGDVAAMVERAQQQGAEVRCGGTGIDRPGWYYRPTVLTGVSEGSEVEQDEVFGPVVSVQSFADESDAVRMANSVRYGLAASIWTGDSARGLRMSSELDFGTVWINSHLTLVSEMPWNGFGFSGYGREMSAYALDDYTRTKHVMTSVGAVSEEEEAP